MEPGGMRVLASLICGADSFETVKRSTGIHSEDLRPILGRLYERRLIDTNAGSGEFGDENARISLTGRGRDEMASGLHGMDEPDRNAVLRMLKEGRAGPGRHSDSRAPVTGTGGGFSALETLVLAAIRDGADRISRIREDIDHSEGIGGTLQELDSRGLIRGETSGSRILGRNLRVGLTEKGMTEIILRARELEERWKGMMAAYRNGENDWLRREIRSRREEIRAMYGLGIMDVAVLGLMLDTVADVWIDTVDPPVRARREKDHYIVGSLDCDG